MTLDYHSKLVIDKSLEAPIPFRVKNGIVTLLAFSQQTTKSEISPRAYKDGEYTRVTDTIVRRKDIGSWNYYIASNDTTCGVFEVKSETFLSKEMSVKNGESGYKCYRLLLENKNVYVSLNDQVNDEGLLQADEAIKSLNY